MISSASRLLIDAQSEKTREGHSNYGAVLAIAKGDYILAERSLLSRLNQLCDSIARADHLWWICQIYNQQLIPKRSKGLISRITACVPADDPLLHHLSLQHARLRRGSAHGPHTVSLQNLTDGEFPHLDLEIAAALLRRGDIKHAQIALQSSRAIHSCEGTMVKARLLQITEQKQEAESLLLTHWPDYKHRLDYSLQLIELLFDLRREESCLPALKKAVEQHACNANPLFERFAQARMLQRQPGPALRLKLLERLPIISGVPVAQPTILSAIYDALGRSDWLSYLPQEMSQTPAHDPELHSNRLMHLSSRCSPIYPNACDQLTELLSNKIRQQTRPFLRQLNLKSFRNLRIGWICADITNHPVARFLVSWLASTSGKFQHSHIVVGTGPCDPRYEQLFKNLRGVRFVKQNTQVSISQVIEQLRQLELDLAIDLNGWTGNHIAPAFIARVAPLQLNYLAYHASSGITEMDIWLGDQQVLPVASPHEWHSEQLVRLNRPFLAWQPHPALPEARAAVSEAGFEASSGVRFGCFNHVRKISDETLRGWARILQALPTAKLVLKAHSASDSATATLLQRRLQRSGLPLHQVIWLPYTATPDEHLVQYAQMDVALDSFPNTGCTTTCEALWMGVPVITLQGSHYVSRMAAAVLHGAGLPEWICESTAAYEELAIQQAEPGRLTWLRQHRNHWRQQMQNSPLGDAQDLMKHLESTFSSLAERRLQEQTLELTAHPPGLVQS